MATRITTQPHRHRILVTDDNEDYAASLALLLEMLGNEVRTAHDGLEAVAVAAEFQPDVILLDISLPKLDGYEACRRIRAQLWAGGVLILALTGWAEPHNKHKARAAGFDDQLVKPVEPSLFETLLATDPKADRARSLAAHVRRGALS